MSEHSILISETANVISARLSDSYGLRRMAVDLYGDASKVGLLADIRNRRAVHVSHAALHDLRRRLGLPYDVRHIVDVPADHDAAVHLSPNGNGSLHTYTVPQDAEVVIVPAGARVVQPKPASGKPKRERTQKDVTRLKRRGWSDAEIERVMDVMYDYPDLMRDIFRLLAVVPATGGDGKAEALASMVDTWLAEDTANPGDLAAVAEVLARLEQPATPVAP